MTPPAATRAPEYHRAGAASVSAVLTKTVSDVPRHHNSPWQRATNENTNGLLRQYFPKSTDLSGYHRDYLEFVAAQLNNRPRKRLGWRTPAEALDQLLSDQDNPPDVALTG